MHSDQDINYTWNLAEEGDVLTDVSHTEIVEALEDVHESIVPETEDFKLEINFFDQKDQEDMLWQARTGLNLDSLCGAVETIIFMSDRPISLQKVKVQIDEELPLRVLHEALSKLQTGYEEKHHGIRLVEVADGYQFRTKATYSKYVQNLFKLNSLVLTPTALEVLAIIAYKQPVSKTDVEKIRGVDSSHIIRALMDKRLVKITGRSEELGRPSQFGTTEEFLEVFNLPNISQLPSEHELNDLASQNSVGNIADIKSVVFMGDKAKFDFDEIEELDRLSSSIKDIHSDTIFTALLKQEEKKRIDGETSGIKKSAFDILEEFVLRDETLRQNRQASESETPMTAIDARSVDIATDEIFNAPVIEDLDIEVELQEEESFEEFIQETLEDEASESEELALEEALDAAFARLSNESSVESESTSEEADLLVEEAIQKGRDLDLDLSFLKEHNSNEE